MISSLADDKDHAIQNGRLQDKLLKKNKHDKKADMETVMSYPVTDTKTKKLS